MFDIVLRGVRSVAASSSDKFLSIVYAELLQNVRVLEATNDLEILDPSGRRSRVTRSRTYAARWFAPDFLPPDRITVGPTGTIESLRVTAPPGLGRDIFEGGIGERHLGFRVRAPNLRPDYVLRRTMPAVVTIQYVTVDAYTKDATPMSWVYRFPRDKPLPKAVRFRLSLPSERPMLAEPRTYRIRNLAKAETARTDFSLDQSEAWERIHNPSTESDLEFDTGLTSLTWSLKPSRVNTALKVEWDWWTPDA